MEKSNIEKSNMEKSNMEKSTINTQPIKKEKITISDRDNEKKDRCCCCFCYNKESIDSRCCGACYCCCPSHNKYEQCYFCPNNLTEYWFSGYVQTDVGYGASKDTCSKDECSFCCVVCFPVKFPLFFPCFLGSVFNHSINCIRGKKIDNNYLC